MNLRLLKIESIPSRTFLPTLFGFPESEHNLYAYCLLQEPSSQFKKAVEAYQSNYPSFITVSKSECSDLYLSFPLKQDSISFLPSFIEKLFSEVAGDLSDQIKNYLYPEYLSKDTYRLKMNSVQLMGIVNVTPDSFSDGGRYFDVSRAVDHALRLEKEGAVIVDIGGESSRPGAAEVTLEEELTRVIPVIEGIREKSHICISVDTTKAEVAEKALLSGADWINDISALRADKSMISVIKRHQCPVVVMHMQGTPQNMQNNPYYQNVCLEVDDFFSECIKALHKHGIEKIILDPGIGFGKRLEDNLALINGATLFRRHGYPLLYGTSRKSFIGTITGKTVDKRLAGSLASLVPLIKKGVNIFRVHDVSETKDFIDILKAVGN